MSVRLRLQRHGAKKRPYYRLVATDQRSPRDGRFNELLGTYDPMVEPNIADINLERVDYWLSVGAQPSERVASVLKNYRDGKFVSHGSFMETNKQRLKARQEAAYAVKPVEAAAAKIELTPEVPAEVAEAAAEEAAGESAES